MKIEEYLNKIDTDITHPGMFAIQLKSDLHDEYFGNKRNFQYSIVATAASIILMIFSTLLIVFPNLSDNILAALGHNSQKSVDITDNNTDISNQMQFSANITKVKDLSQLKESKTYIIKKVPGYNHGNLFYVSEIESHKKPAIFY